MNYTRLKSMTATIVAAIMMGCLGFFVRGAGMDAGMVAFFRFLIGFVLMSGVVATMALTGKQKVTFSSSSLLSGVAISLCILFYFFAIESINIGLAAFTLYLGPVFAIIGESIISGKLPSLRQGIIIALAFAGFFLISSLASINLTQMNTGLVYAFLSGFFYGAYILINRLIPQGVSLSLRVFWQFLAAVITIGATCIFRGVGVDGIETGWPYVVTIGFVQGFIVLLLTGYAIKNLSAAEFGALSYIEPLVAVLLGFYLYNESLSISQIVGIGLIVVATSIQCISIKSSHQYEHNDQN